MVDTVTEGVIEKKYYYFHENAIKGLLNKEDLKTEYETKELSYEIYKPKYNTGAQKIRSISIKESNYFNILQTIAETFGAWLDIAVVRNMDDGTISQKVIKLKNYIGKDKNAYFKYGINVKDIERTYESKNIVTKLAVKQNSNEHAEDGFCSIARAAANPTGESIVYDF
jgi:phage minor structural protein